MPDRAKVNLNQQDAHQAARIRSGDEYAFRDLFRSYYTLLVKLAWRFVRDKQLAEDVVADVLLKIWQNRSDWHPEISIKAYLFQATRNQAINQAKRQQREQERFSDVDEFVSTANVTPEDILHQKEIAEEISRAIHQLPDRGRDIFRMHRFDHFKYNEIAKALNIHVGTVETHMVRALKFLRNRLKHLR